MKKNTLLVLIFLSTLFGYAQTPYLVKDFSTSQSSVSSNPEKSIVFNNLLYFVAAIKDNKFTLMVSGGSSANTVPLIPNISTNANFRVSNLVVFKNQLFFTLSEGSTVTLCKTNGINGNLERVKVIPSEASVPPNTFTVVGDLMYFVAQDSGFSFPKLYVTDGTNAGTIELKSFNWPDELMPMFGNKGKLTHLTNHNGKLYFIGAESVNGYALWESDGTVGGTKLVKTFASGQNKFSITELVAINGKLYLRANGTNTAEIYNGEPWVSDGTSSGTVMLKQISASNGSSPSKFVYFKNEVYFFTNVGNSDFKLWKTDGTEVNTQVAVDFSFAGSGSKTFVDARVLGDKIFFDFSENSLGREPWVTDGTTQGTYMLKDINPLTQSSYGQGSNPLTNGGAFLNGKFVFSANNGNNNIEVWVTDLTSNGTQLLKEINATGAAYPSNYITYQGHIYFTANDGVVGSELWRTDGTTNGTVLVKDILQGTASSATTIRDVLNGKLFVNHGLATDEGFNFSAINTADDSVEGLNEATKSISAANLIKSANWLYFRAPQNIIWKTNGTKNGTTQLREQSGTVHNLLGQIDDKVVFDVTLNSLRSIMITDGTELGTINLTGATNTSLQLFASGGDKVFYSKYSNPNYVLSTTDGTVGGTLDVKVFPNVINKFLVVEGVLYFVCNNNVWKSDGTEIGTVQLTTFGSDLTINSNLFAGPTKIYYTAFASGTSSIFEIDLNSNVGTKVKDVFSGNYKISQAPRLNNTQYFIIEANSQPDRYFLWKTDHTETGTTQVLQIKADGTNYTNALSTLVPLNNKFYFVSNKTTQKSIFETDGISADYTDVLANISKDNYYLDVQEFTTVGNKLYFTANTTLLDQISVGRELWALDLAKPVTCNPGLKIVGENGLGKGVSTLSEAQTNPNSLNCGCDTYNSLVVSINSEGATPVTGNIASKVFIDNAQNTSFVKRHYDIQPNANARTASGKVTLYFTQAEFDAYNETGVRKPLPTSSSDQAGKLNLKVWQKNAVGDSEGNSTSYNTSVTIIDPADTDVIWNAALSRWEISFETVGFGGFWISSDLQTLPLTWINYDVKRTFNNGVALIWKVVEKDVDTYIVERSFDGSKFEQLVTVPSKGNGHHQYQYIDETPKTYENLFVYYRIREISKDGNSSTTDVKVVKSELSALDIYPNPIKNKFTIVSKIAQELKVFDATGKLVFVKMLTVGENLINDVNWTRGVYLAKTTTNSYKLIKD